MEGVGPLSLDLTSQIIRIKTQPEPQSARNYLHEVQICKWFQARCLSTVSNKDVKTFKFKNAILEIAFWAKPI